jgi:hypothetical protein
MVRRASLVLAALVLTQGLAGCSGSDEPQAKRTAAPTPVEDLVVAEVRLVRGAFCDRVPGPAVEAALGAEADADDAWSNGDPVPGSGEGSGEVGHEIGCAWTGPAGAAARAWVFARPVSTDLAATLVADAGRQQGCTAEPTPTFGAPAVLQTCTLADGVQRVRRAGLFGDTWLTCEVSGATSGDVGRRTDRWCAAVVAALDSGSG